MAYKRCFELAGLFGGFMMKYLLIMQLIFDGYKAGGATVETVIFENLND